MEVCMYFGYRWIWIWDLMLWGWGWGWWSWLFCECRRWICLGCIWVCVGLSVWCLVLWGLEQEKKIKNPKKKKKFEQRIKVEIFSEEGKVLYAFVCNFLFFLLLLSWTRSKIFLESLPNFQITHLLRALPVSSNVVAFYTQIPSRFFVFFPAEPNGKTQRHSWFRSQVRYHCTVLHVRLTVMFCFMFFFFFNYKKSNFQQKSERFICDK